jgi:hypothetical protein
VKLYFIIKKKERKRKQLLVGGGRKIYWRKILEMSFFCQPLLLTRTGSIFMNK